LSFESKKIDRIIDYFIYIALGIALSYLTTSIIDKEIPSINTTVNFEKSNPKKSANKIDLDKIILSENIFKVDTGIEKRKRIKHTKAKVVSNINGYKLIGFIRGKRPMVLLKKSNKPAVIITKKKGLNKLWFLYKIGALGVYLRNKKTGEVKLFSFAKEKVSAPILSMAANNSESNIEKVKVSRSVVSKVANINNLLRQINVVPVFKNGKAYGYRINFLSPISILRKIGLRVGDIIVSINGEPTTNPSSLLGIYSQLRDMNSVSINLIRNSRKKTIFVEIE